MGSVLNAPTNVGSIFMLLLVLVRNCILPRGIDCVCDSWVGLGWVLGSHFVKLTAILWIDGGSDILFFILLLNIIVCEYS